VRRAAGLLLIAVVALVQSEGRPPIPRPPRPPIVRPDPPAPPHDLWLVPSSSEAYRLAGDGLRVTLFVGWPDMMVGTRMFHCRVRSGSLGLADGMYTLVGSAGSGRPVETVRVWYPYQEILAPTAPDKE
jgi:hypothetical protein